VVALSFFVSSLVRLYGWLGILARGGPLNGLLSALGLAGQPISFLFTPTAVIIGLADFGIPYAVLTLIGSINNLDPSLEQASQNLGATRWQTFLRVTLPLTFPGLLAALILTFALNVSAVLTPIVLGGSRVPTMATQIYTSMVQTLNYPFASAAVVILLVTVFVLTAATGRALRVRAVQ
jgi:spermidine/putrescine transport system permease protein